MLYCVAIQMRHKMSDMLLLPYLLMTVYMTVLHYIIFTKVQKLFTKLLNAIMGSSFSFLSMYQNFRKALEQEWKVSLSHRCELNVSFKENHTHVKYPSNIKGWNIVPSSSNCNVRHAVYTCTCIYYSVCKCLSVCWFSSPRKMSIIPNWTHCLVMTILLEFSLK